ADTPAAGPAGSAAELPGTCSQFIVDQQGTIHQLVPLTLQCRHTIGLNRWAIGIEMVQSDAGHDSLWATDQILHRTKQITAVVALVRALMARYDLSKSDVIGHGTANDDPRFVELEGWRNDHTDWQAEDVRVLRRRL
ncbi:MAG TPA: peptidoglycan recognition family protein, partial [Gaiellales bacterium]|nr:peptidoglycan recognition family protein [Gaiellales bacterium]